MTHSCKNLGPFVRRVFEICFPALLRAGAVSEWEKSTSIISVNNIFVFNNAHCHATYIHRSPFNAFYELNAHGVKLAAK